MPALAPPQPSTPRPSTRDDQPVRNEARLAAVVQAAYIQDAIRR